MISLHDVTILAIFFLMMFSYALYVLDDVNISYYFKKIRTEHYLKQVFQNDPKHYKSSYRYFSRHTWELARDSGPQVRRIGEKPREYLVTVTGLRKWLEGVSKTYDIENFLERLKMEFEHRRGMNGCYVTDDIRNHASLCIKMINDLLQKLQNAEGFMYHTETKNTDRKGTTFSDADIKSKNPYIHSANKMMDMIERLNPDINSEIFKRIQKIDYQVATCKHYSGTNKQQWDNTIKPMIIEVASKETLSEENKTKIMGILDKVSENIQKADAEYKDMQASATLDSVQAFMDMNGW